MAYFQAVKALKDENTSIEKLLDCLINLSIDHGYILACTKFWPRPDADADMIRIDALSRALRFCLLARVAELADARSIGSDRCVIKYLKRKTQQPQAVTRG